MASVFPMTYLCYKEKKYRSLRLKFSTRVPFQKILHSLNSISFNGTLPNDEQAVYAILELINNSLRAHREQKIEEQISLHLRAQEERIHIRLKDHGGGFDPNRLPYDIHADAGTVDTNGQAFEAYREAYEYHRFGMGLLLAKKIFPGFKLRFYDPQGTFPQWKKETTLGTLIELSSQRFPEQEQ